MNFLFYMVMRDFLYGVIRNHTFNILPMELVEKKYTGQTEKMKKPAPSVNAVRKMLDA